MKCWILTDFWMVVGMAGLTKQRQLNNTTKLFPYRSWKRMMPFCSLFMGAPLTLQDVAGEQGAPFGGMGAVGFKLVA